MLNKFLIVALACVSLSALGCITRGVIIEARQWAKDVSVEGEALNPKVSVLWVTGMIFDLDGVRGSGQVDTQAAGPTTRPAGDETQ